MGYNVVSLYQIRKVFMTGQKPDVKRIVLGVAGAAVGAAAGLIPYIIASFLTQYAAVFCAFAGIGAYAGYRIADRRSELNMALIAGSPVCVLACALCVSLRQYIPLLELFDGRDGMDLSYIGFLRYYAGEDAAGIYYPEEMAVIVRELWTYMLTAVGAGILGFAAAALFYGKISRMSTHNIP